MCVRACMCACVHAYMSGASFLNSAEKRRSCVPIIMYTLYVIIGITCIVPHYYYYYYYHIIDYYLYYCYFLNFDKFNGSGPHQRFSSNFHIL